MVVGCGECDCVAFKMCVCECECVGMGERVSHICGSGSVLCCLVL